MQLRCIRWLIFLWKLHQPQVPLSFHCALLDKVNIPVARSLHLSYSYMVCQNFLAVSALQVLQQFTDLDLGWQDDPCSPTQWDHIGCEGSLVTSLYGHIAHECVNYGDYFSCTVSFMCLISGNFQTSTLGQLVLLLVTCWISKLCKLL